MKCQILFSGKNKKNIINLSSAENAQRVVKVNSPTRIHDHVIPKLRLTLQNQYCFNKWVTIGNVTAQTEDFCYGAEKEPYGPPAPYTHTLSLYKR